MTYVLNTVIYIVYHICILYLYYVFVTQLSAVWKGRHNDDYVIFSVITGPSFPPEVFVPTSLILIHCHDNQTFLRLHLFYQYYGISC